MNPENPKYIFNLVDSVFEREAHLKVFELFLLVKGIYAARTNTQSEAAKVILDTDTKGQIHLTHIVSVPWWRDLEAVFIHLLPSNIDSTDNKEYVIIKDSAYNGASRYRLAMKNPNIKSEIAGSSVKKGNYVFLKSQPGVVNGIAQQILGAYYNNPFLDE